MIFKDFLDTISYFYYPKGKSVFDIDYNRTIETKRYLEKVHFNYINNQEFILFLNHLNKKINPLLAIEFKMGTTPSFNCQITLKLDDSKIKVLSIYISHLIPFFHLCQLEGDFCNRTVSLIEAYSSEEVKLIDSVKTEITNMLFFYEFPRDFLLNKIPNLKEEEKFTYLNAFFTDHYRILNF